MTDARGLQRHRLVANRRALALVWALLALWPVVAANDYLLSLGIAFLLNLLLIASLNVIMGWAGQVSLAHASFYGLGAYAAGVLNVRYGWSPWIDTVAAVAVVGACAAAVGAACLRLRGPYLSMATLGAGAILGVLFVELVPWTGGPNGLAGIAPYPLAGKVDLESPGRFYWLAWIASGATMWLLLNLMLSRPGRALKAIAGGEVGANTLGVDTFATKVVAFALSAGCAGLAGALYAHFNLFASPETFGFSTSVLLVVMVALGGSGHYWGPLYGAALYTIVPELLRRFQDAELIVFGVCMLIVLLRVPGGIAALVDRALARIPRRAAPRTDGASHPTATGVASRVESRS